jgi:ATP-dependent Clp protease ATP-binding subunit ClpC
VGFTTKSKQDGSNEFAKSVIQNALKKAFSPEFLNRIDDVVIFNTLTRDDIHKIIDIELQGLYARIVAMGYSLQMSEEAKDYIAEKGYDIQFGARPLKRAIQKYLEDPMAEVIIKSNMKHGDTISISFNKSKEEVAMKVIHPDESTEATVDEADGNDK